MFVKPCVTEDGRMRQGEQRGAAAGVQAAELSHPGGLETGPGGHRDGWSGVASVAGGGAGHQGGPPGPSGTIGTVWGRPSAWSLICHTGVTTQGLPPARGQRDGLSWDRPAWPWQPTAASWPQSSPLAWPKVPSLRPEPLICPQRSRGNSVSVFTPVVSASESFILTADCIKIPVVIGSGAVFSTRILNQAFCPRPERSVSEYKDAGDGITQDIFPLLNFLPPPPWLNHGSSLFAAK